MQPSRIRQKISQRQIALTAKAVYTDPEAIELIGTAGFDAIWLCLEHKRLDPSNVYAIIQACRLAGVDALVRIKPADHTDLLWVLEAGARAIMLPRVRTAEEVRTVVADMKFAPLGRRGFDGIHAEAGFGRVPAADYLADANRETVLVVQIEEPEILPHIDEVASIPGVDILFVGPSDLSLGLNAFGRTNSPEVQGVIRQVAEACRRHGKVAGIPCGPGDVAGYRDLGYGFFNVSSDYRCLINGMKSSLETARAALAPAAPQPAAAASR